MVLCAFLIKGNGMDVPFWKFGGNTVITSNFVRLTPDRQSKKGTLWNTYVRMQYTPSFKVTCSLLLLPHSLFRCTTGRWCCTLQFMGRGRTCLVMDLRCGTPKSMGRWGLSLEAEITSQAWGSSLIHTVTTMEDTV